jgi:hypothetical protein
VAIAHQPEFLKLSVSSRELPLHAPESERVVYVEAPEEALGAEATVADEQPAEPFTIAYDLALFEGRREGPR